jgi:hypothetical protein
MAVVWRFFVIAFAYGIACLAAAVTLVLGTFAAEGMAVPRDADMVTFLWFFTFATGGAVGLFAFVPAAVAIALAEGFAWRSVLFYALFGAGVGLFYGLGFPRDDPSSMFLGRAPEMLSGAGVAAGLVYWLIAGRNAGRWHTSESTAVTKP